MPVVGDRLHGPYRNGVRAHERVDPLAQTMFSNGFRNVHMRRHRQRVHAGIGAPRRVYGNKLAGHPVNGFFERLLHRRTVVLTRDGEDTLDRFNGFINQFADELISNIPRIKARTIELLIGRFASIADTLTVAAERMAEDMHLVGDPNDAADSKA